MDIPNLFLHGFPQVHNRVIGNCLCETCRPLRLQQIRVRGNLNNLYHGFMNSLPRKEEACLDKLYSNTVQLIVQGKAYKETSLEGTEYRYFKCWAKNQPEFRELSEKQFSKFTEKVNEAAWVFDNWTKITANLTDRRLTEIDARRLSINQFYRAGNIDWCLSYNETLRKKRKPDDPLYSNEKFNGVFNAIVESGILEDINHDPKLAASLGERLKMQMISYCRQQQN